MKASDLLARLRALDITVAAHGDRLRIKASPGALTDELKRALTEHKAELLVLLSGPQDSGTAPALSPTSRQSPLALSFSQQRIWFLDKLLPDSTAYALVSAHQLEGTLDVGALQRSLDDLVARHEILRTTFGETAGVPWQRVGDPRPVDLVVDDLRQIAPDEQLEEAARRASTLGDQTFDLAAGPLLRVRLMTCSDARHVLVFAMHHITYDGWSLGILYRELSTLYAAHCAGEGTGHGTGHGTGEKPDLPPLRLHYADYAAWQQRWLDGPQLERLLTHWSERLDGLAQLDLPTDRPRPAIQTLVGRRRSVHVPPELADGLSALGRQKGATLFMTLLAAFSVLLHRYAGQDDVALGSPVANRGRTELEGLIGPFLNMLVLRADLSGAPTFLELLERIRATTVDALEHQELPFEKLVEALQPERDRSRNPLFQVSFAVHNADMEGPALEGLTSRPLPVARTTTIFDIAVDVFERADGLRVQFTYSSALLDDETIEHMSEAYCALLEAVVAEPGRAVGELPLMRASERRRWLAGLDDAAADCPRDKSVHDLIAEQARRTPDAVAVEFEDQRLTYAALDARANRIANVLRDRGVQRGTLVGLCVNRSLDMLAGMLGIFKAGGAYVPLDPSFPTGRLAFMLEDCDAQVLLTQQGLLEALDTLPDAVLHLDADADEIAAASPTAPADGARPDDLAYVIYTSGSTGQPKGVQVAHRAVVNFLTSMARQPGLTAHDVLTAVTTISFDIAGLELFLPLTVGARVVLASREVAADGQRLQQLLADSGTTVLQATPATWQMLLQTGWSDPSLKMICGGEALPRPLAERLLEAGGELWNVYGPTETTIWSTACPVASHVESGAGPVPIGKAIANTRVLVLDAGRQPLPPGAPGELYIGGLGLAQGYLQRPELTAERFVPDPFHEDETLYRTGDRVRQRADGSLLFLGRMDTQVKLRGFRIELGEIEATLSEQPDVREAVVLLRTDHDSGEATDPRLVGYVTPTDPDADVPVEALRAWLRERLPEYMVPSVFVTLDELPRTPNRKIDRKALPAPTGERQSARDLVEPRTDLEQTVAGIWIELLPVDQVGVHDDFFELGGHSLLVTQLTSRIRDQLGVEMPLGRAFETPTIEGLARWIEQAAGPRRAKPTPGLAVVPRGEDMAVSYAQQRLWFLDQLGAGSAYNLPLAMHLDGPLDQRALQESLAALTARHESLRTTFRLVGSQPRQVIAPTVDVRIEIVDAAVGPDADRETVIQDHASREADRPFDLALGPLVRARLLVLGPADHVLLLTVHHAISDGWSLSILSVELVEHYQAAREGSEPELAPLPIQYADFAAWQREHLDVDSLSGQMDYWTAQLGTNLSVLQLPTDRPRPAVQTFRGGAHRFQLSSPLTEGLDDLARALGVTPAMLFLAGFGALLARISGQEDIAVGSPIANRTRSELEPLIGFFANTLVLRMDLTGDPSFREVARRVQRMSVQAYEHQDLPFERLVEQLSPERSLSRNPLFQVVFAMQEAPPPMRSLDDLAVRMLPMAVTTSRTDLELYLRRSPEGLKGLLVYSTDLFDGDTIARLADHYLTLLSGLVADPDCRLSRLPMLSDAERHQQLATWNDTALAYSDDRCIHELIEQRAAETPNAPAVVHHSDRLSFAELNERANRVAHVLRSMGVGPDQLVGLCVERGVAMIVGLLGILKAGGAYVPMDPGYPRERLAFMVRDSGAPVIVTCEPLLDLLPELDAAVLCLDRDTAQLAAASSRNPALLTTADNLAYAIYTSGSTGTPKCALLQHRGLCSLSEAQRRMFDVGPDSRVLQFSSFSFDAATFEIVMALPKGGTLFLGDRHDLLPGVDLLEFLREHRISIVTLTPTALGALPFAELPDLATITVAGEACPTELVSRWAPGRRFFNLYGPTETTIWATATELTPGDDVHIGRPIGNMEVYILDAHGQPVPVGVPGELHIGGIGLARGYHARPELTAERFITHPFSDQRSARLYRSGDRACFRPDGNIDYLGRLDHQVKLRGHRIELGEIEAALETHPAVRESLAMIREDSPGIRRIVGYVRYVIGDPATDGDAEQAEDSAGGDLAGRLRRSVAQRLPDYMVPAAVVVLEAFPVTPNGKTDRDALPPPDMSGAGLDGDYMAPRSAAEETLARIWATALGLEQVGVHDNFFTLGGDSILSIQVVVAATRAGLGLRARDLFEHQTVAELARVASDTTTSSAEQGPVTGAVPLLPIQRWFLDQELVDPHHFNQAFHLQAGIPMTVKHLGAALTHLAQHHDALRLTLTRGPEGWSQHIAGPERRVPLRTVDLSNLSTDERARVLASEAERTQTSLDPSSGVLLAAVLFTDQDPGPSSLLLVVHHLAVDAVSWPVLLEDLGAALEASAAGEAIHLPPKTTSFLSWATQLVRYARTPEVADHARAWLERPWSTVEDPPRDTAGESGDDGNTVSSVRRITVGLDTEATHALLHEVPAAYDTRIDEALVTALARALCTWTDADQLLLDLEGHGREDVLPDADVTRTVGWFTSLFPALFDVDRNADPGATLLSIKQQLRAIPDRGLSYGLARYLSDDQALVSAMKALPSPRVTFNYMGMLGAGMTGGSSVFGFSDRPAGSMRSPRQARRHWLEINGMVRDGALTMVFGYSEALHRAATVQRIADDFIRELHALIEHCRSAAGRPADVMDVSKLGKFGWSQDDLDDLLTDLNDDRDS